MQAYIIFPSGKMSLLPDGPQFGTPVAE